MDAMKSSLPTTLVALLLAASSGLCAEDAPKPLYPQNPTETPPNFTPVTDTWDNELRAAMIDRKSTRLNSSHNQISNPAFCLKKKKKVPEPEIACELARLHSMHDPTEGWLATAQSELAEAAAGSPPVAAAHIVELSADVHR